MIMITGRSFNLYALTLRAVLNYAAKYCEYGEYYEAGDTWWWCSADVGVMQHCRTTFWCVLAGENELRCRQNQS